MAAEQADTHSDNFEETQRHAAVLDQATSAVLAVHQAKGLLHQALVVLCTEFGRKPPINENDRLNYHEEVVACLLAGAGMGGWDTHSDNFEGTPRQAVGLNQAISVLLERPDAKGLLEQTLVVLGTEFGRPPRINDNDRRDHRDTFTCLLGGAGMGVGREELRSRSHLNCFQSLLSG